MNGNGKNLAETKKKLIKMKNNFFEEYKNEKCSVCKWPIIDHRGSMLCSAGHFCSICKLPFMGPKPRCEIHLTDQIIFDFAMECDGCGACAGDRGGKCVCIENCYLKRIQTCNHRWYHFYEGMSTNNPQDQWICRECNLISKEYPFKGLWRIFYLLTRKLWK